MITPSRIARLLGLIGLAAFLGLAARTSTATQAFEDGGTPPPPPTIGGASLLKEPRPVLVSRVDAFPFAQDAPNSTTIDPPIAPDEIIPPHEPAAEAFDELGPIPSPPATDAKATAKPDPKPAKDGTPEVVPVPLVPADAPPIAPDLTGDDFPAIDPTPEPLTINPVKTPQPKVGDDLPAIDPTPEPLTIDPVTTPQPKVDDPVLSPAPVERRSAWTAQREATPRPAPVGVEVEINEVPVVPSNDPDAQARSFVERNQREAEARLEALQGEANELRGRLVKLEAAIQQWQNLANAMKEAQDAVPVKKDAPQTRAEGRAGTVQPEAATTTLEPLPMTPRRAVVVSEPQSARAQDVPAPPLR